MNGISLLLGCGDQRRDGWIHHDRVKHSPHIHIAHDLNERPWPWATNGVAQIEANHVLEHLWDTVAFFDECHRILEPGGTLLVRVPHCNGENAWKDPTHVRAFHPEAFSYFDPETGMGSMFGKYYTRRYWHHIYTITNDEEIESKLRVVK